MDIAKICCVPEWLLIHFTIKINLALSLPHQSGKKFRFSHVSGSASSSLQACENPSGTRDPSVEVAIVTLLYFALGCCSKLPLCHLLGPSAPQSLLSSQLLLSKPEERLASPTAILLSSHLGKYLQEEPGLYNFQRPHKSCPFSVSEREDYTHRRPFLPFHSW